MTAAKSQSCYKAGEVMSVSADTVVITSPNGPIEYFTTRNTVAVDGTRNGAAIEKGAMVEAVIDPESEEIMMIVVTREALDMADGPVYGIVTGYNGITRQNGTSYYEYTVKNNEEEFTLLFTAKQADFTGKLVSFEPVSDNVYSADDILIFAKPFADDNYDLADVYVKELNEGDKTLTFFDKINKVENSFEGDEYSQRTYALDDRCAIVYVNAEDGALGRDIGVNAFDSVTGYRNAAIVTTTDARGNRVIVAIFVETSNKTNILP